MLVKLKFNFKSLKKQTWSDVDLNLNGKQLYPKDLG